MTPYYLVLELPCMVASPSKNDDTSGKRFQKESVSLKRTRSPGPSASSCDTSEMGVDGSLRGTWPMRLEMFGRDRGDGVAGVCLGRRMNCLERSIDPSSLVFDARVSAFFGVAGGAWMVEPLTLTVDLKDTSSRQE